LKKILFIGKLPPPIGGVTVYNEKIIKALQEKEFENYIIQPSISFINYIPTYLKNKLVHLSLSNSYLKLFLVIISKLLGKKIVTTLHGSFGRFSKFRNYIELLVIRISDKTLILNEKSYKRLKEYKQKLVMSSTNFDIMEEVLSPDIINLMEKSRSEYSKVFCTNSWKLTFDKNGDEIYSISKLVNIFKDLPEYMLIVSDPSGTNKDYIENKLKLSPTKNVNFINIDHPFTEILKLSDGFIRATTTDGDALSVRESINLGIPTFTSDIVDRPKECILFNLDSISLLKGKLREFNYSKKRKKSTDKNNLVDEIINIYYSLL
jgi:glycosyltransferase involved in cell wall biosynthesis